VEQGQGEIDENLKLRTTPLSEEPVKNEEIIWIDEGIRYLEEN
jgi:hypothetical protein